MSKGPTLLSLMFFLVIVQCGKKAKQPKVTAPLGELHSFSLTKYEKPQEFSFLISCQQNALINFELSSRLKTLHRNIFLNVEFETHDCIKAYQDTKRVLINEDSWEMVIENTCCSKGNSTRVFNETIKVTVRDGFKILGIPIRTKLWNSIMPILISLSICLFVWSSNFSQPRAQNVSFLSRFYRQTKPKLQAQQQHIEFSIDKVQASTHTQKQK